MGFTKMKRKSVLLMVAGALGILLLSLAMNQGPMNDAPAQQAKAMVAHAVEHVDEHGIASLIRKVNAGDIEFHDGELYVFVMDRTGTVAAHPIDSNLVGRTAEQVKDPHGNTFIMAMVEAATSDPDGSWVDYHWTHPVSGKTSEKSSWLVMKDGHIIGSGVYPKPK